MAISKSGIVENEVKGHAVRAASNSYWRHRRPRDGVLAFVEIAIILLMWRFDE